MNVTTEILPLQNEIVDVVDQVTQIFRGVGSRLATDAEAKAMENPWNGCIAIEGGFKGAVTLTCPKRFAFDLASTMLDMPREEANEDAARDALAELTNVVGGNLKSLISSMVGDSCRLGLPVVATGELRVTGAHRRQEFWFQCGDDMLVIGLVQIVDATSLGVS